MKGIIMEEHKLKWEIIDFSPYNPTHNTWLAISSFSVVVDEVTGLPKDFVLVTAIDKYLANCDICEFPLFIEADKVFHTPAHTKLLEEFRKGQPFVLVNPIQLRVCRQFVYDKGCYNYIGTAEGFTVIETQWLGHGKEH